MVMEQPARIAPLTTTKSTELASSAHGINILLLGIYIPRAHHVMLVVILATTQVIIVNHALPIPF